MLAMQHCATDRINGPFCCMHQKKTYFSKKEMLKVDSIQFFTLGNGPQL